MKICILLLIACFFEISSVYAQDFVQPVQREPLRTKIARSGHNENSSRRSKLKDLDYQHFKLSVNAGYSDHISSMAEKIPSPLTDYVKDLQSGRFFGLDLRYYPVEPLGLGIKYSAYNSRCSKAIFTSDSNYSTSDQDLSIQFIGPCISTRYLHADMKNALYFNMAYGSVAYRVNYQADVVFTAKGNTMATVYDLGYDLGLTQNVGVGLQVSYLRGFLKEYHSSLEDKTQKVHLESGKVERLHRLDFSIGLKLNL